MALNNSIETEELKRFLFHELSDDERDVIEERFFEDEELFYELVDLENDLVDSYARNELSADDQKRFENSLAKVPERVEKLANAKALQSFIVEEKKTVVPEAAPQASLWDKISGFFTFEIFTLQFATAAVMILLVAGAGFLVYDRVRLNEELARIKAEQSNFEDLERRSKLLQEQLTKVEEREKAIQTELENSSGQADILGTQLNRERTERARLEKELERLKNEKRNLPPGAPDKNQNQPPQPLIASVVLPPFANTRGGGNVKSVEIPVAAQQISVTLQIPRDSTAKSYDVKFADKTIGSKLKPSTTSSGNKFVVVNLSVKRLSTDKNNVFDVAGDDGKSYKFIFRIKRK